MPIAAKAAPVACSISRSRSSSSGRGGRIRGILCMVAPPRMPSFPLGVGLGGFVDGILLHQVLQWHHMLTGTASHPAATVAGLEANTLADGLFHVGTWLAVTAATVLLLRQWQRGEL